MSLHRKLILFCLFSNVYCVVYCFVLIPRILPSKDVATSYASPSLSKSIASMHSDTCYSEIDQEVAVSKPKKPSFSSLPASLVPLSLNPLLLVSSNPLLSELECNLLSDWCKQNIRQHGRLTKELLDEKAASLEEGAQILRRLQQTINKDIFGLHCCGDGDAYDVMPRFISYDNEDDGSVGSSPSYDSIDNATTLLPDGLHVDTNNGKCFRHWTLLLYLDSCKSSGATTFPLAVPYKQESVASQKHNVLKDLSDARKISKNPITDAQRAAQILIMEENIEHTRFVEMNEPSVELSKMIEEEAVALLKQTTTMDANDQSPRTGIRVLPRQGHICLFSSLTEDGYPNPLSYHGGEALSSSETKEILTFFYEIPIETFSNRGEFGDRAKEREHDFLHFHFVS